MCLVKRVLAFYYILISLCNTAFTQHKAVADTSMELRRALPDTSEANLFLKKADTLIGKQQYGAALQYSKEASLLSNQSNDYFGVMRGSFLTARIYAEIENGDSAKHYFSKSYSYALRLHDTVAADQCVEQIASLYKYSLLSDNDSLVHYSKILLTAPLHREAATLNQLNFDVGYAYYQRGLVDSALKYVFVSLQLAEQRKDTTLIILSLCGRSAIWNAAQHYPQAMQAVLQAISVLNKNLAANSDISVVVYVTLGWIYEKSKSYDSLFLNSSRLLPIVQNKKDKYYVNLMYYRQAVYYNSIGNPDKALNLLQTSLHNIGSTDANFFCCAYREMGRSYALKGLINQAIIYLKKSIENARNIHDPGELMETYELLWRVYMKSKMYQPAMNAYMQYNFFKDSIASMHNIASMNLLSTQYEFGKKEDEIKLLSAENELKTALAQKENQRKNFALAGIGIIVLAGGYGFYWLRKKKQFQNLQSLMNERLRISRELHDEVGATLSGVAMYSHLTKTQLQSQDLAGVENSLAIMQDSSAQMVNKLNDIVWLINPDKSSLPGLMQRLEEYARKMAAAKNMGVSVNVSESIHQYQLSMECRRNIYLFCKEAINNAVKYSKGTLLELGVKENGTLLTFSVRDNGRGFDPETIKQGNGLNNLRQRAETIGAQCVIEVEEQKGTHISCIINTVVSIRHV